MKICHIECDIDGSSTISHLIPQYIESFPCYTFKDVEGVVQGIRGGRIAAQMVVVDPVNSFADKLRDDLIYSSASNNGSIWDNRKKLKADWDIYRETQDMVNRVLTLVMELSRSGIYCMFIAHEMNTKGSESRVDPLGSTNDKYIPDLQKKINSCIMARASAICRMTYAPLPFAYEGQQYPRGSRILVLNASDDSAAGLRVPWDHPQPPPYMPIIERDPYAFVRFVQVMGRVPKVTLLYGPPKIGKTSFAAGAAYL